MGSLGRYVRVAILCLTWISATTFAQEKFFDSNGVRIRYVEQGSGDAIVLIHGNGGSLKSWIDAGVLTDPHGISA